MPRPAVAHRLYGMVGQHELGRRGEDVAARHLGRSGWRILARNFRLGHKEIDIVARRGRLVAFVEVKTRRNAVFGDPLEAITPAKRREIECVAQAWVARYGGTEDTYRFDAIAVYWSGPEPVVSHVADAWRM